MRDVWAVIMAGGVGSRFWPLSRARRPKQLLDLFDVLGVETREQFPQPLWLELLENVCNVIKFEFFEDRRGVVGGDPGDDAGRRLEPHMFEHGRTPRHTERMKHEILGTNLHRVELGRDLHIVEVCQGTTQQARLLDRHAP